MTTFDRYMLSRLMVLFGFFALVLVAVYWVNRAISLFDRLIAGGQNLSIFLEFTILTLPTVILNVLPVSALVASLYGINRMSSDSELTIAHAAAIGPWRLARAPLVFGLLVAMMIGVLAHFLVPMARSELGERGQELSKDVTAKLLTAGEFIHPSEGITFYVRDITERGELLGLYLDDRRNPEIQTTFTAERALLISGDAESGTSPRLIMFNGSAQSVRKTGKAMTIVTFDDFAYGLESLSKAGDRKPDLREYDTFRLLAAKPQDLVETQAQIGDFISEAHSRFSRSTFALVIPVLCLSFLLFGSFSRLGLWRQILLAVFTAITLQMLTNLTENEVVKTPSLWILSYAPSALGLGLAALFLWISTRAKHLPKITAPVRKGHEL